MQRLFLDNKEVDLPPKTIAQTLQINDMAEVKDRNLNHTNRFTLPPTPRNIEVMEYLGVPGSKSRKAYIKIPAKYVYNGVEMTGQGFAKVNEGSEDGFDVTVYSGNAGLYETILGLSLIDLDYTDMNHALNGATHLASLDHTSGYIYALMDSGFATISGIVNSERQVATVFKHTLWDMIFSQAGFTYSGAIFQDEEFLKEVVAPTKGYDVVGDVQTETPAGSTSSTPISKNVVNLKDPENEEEVFDLIGNGLIGSEIRTGDKIYFTTPGLYHITVTLSYTMEVGQGFIFAKLDGKRAGSSVTMIADGLPQVETIEFYIQAVAGTVIKFFIDHTAVDVGSNKFGIDFTAEVDTVLKSVDGGLIIKFEEIMPEVTQTTFIKSIMQDYGLIFQARKNTNHYDFVTMEELVNNRASAEDWSGKLLGLGKETYSIGKYSQSNVMLYKYESNDVQDTSYDGEIKAAHENISDRSTLFTSIYTISNKTQTRNIYPVYQVPLWEEKDEQEGTVVNNLETQFRSFKLKYIDEAITFKFGNIAGTTTRADNMPFLSLENMQYSFYIASHWQGFQRILNAQKKRVVPMLLKPSDIDKLDFLTLKYFKQLGQYYYLNKVSNFVDDMETMVTLIQTNELTVNQPPSQLGDKTYTLNHGGNKVLTLMDFTDTAPIYVDPEFDQPETIKITGGFDSEIVLLVNGAAVTSETVFDANDFMAEFVDQGGDPLAHSAVYTWTIQSYNNENFSAQTGQFTVNVNTEVNLAPIADAGNNQSAAYSSTTSPGVNISTDGSASTDPNGDALTYLWTAVGLSGLLTLTNADTASANISGDALPNQHNTQITMTLRVTDPAGLFSEDTMIITLIDLEQV